MELLRTRKKFLGLVLAFAMVLTITGVFISLVLQDRQAYQRVRNNYVIETRLQTALLDVEAGQDADEDYRRANNSYALRTYRTDFQQAFYNLQILRGLLAGNSQQTRRLETLQKDISAYWKILETLTQKRAPVSGLVSPLLEITLFAKVHRSAESIQQAQEDTLEMRAREQLATQGRVNIAFVCFLIIISLLLALLVIAVRREEAEKVRRAHEKQEALQQAAQRRNEELQGLARRLVKIQEAERGRLAHELHEEVGQVLTGLKLSLKGVTKSSEAMREQQLQWSQDLVTELIRQVRSLSLDLRPDLLDDFGLVPALNWYCKQYQEQTEISVDLVAQGIDDRMDGAVETTAYRIIQEALASATHHSDIKSITVHLIRQEDYLTVQFTGQGNITNTQSALNFCDESCLTELRERATLIGGTLDVTSEQDQSMAIRARLPVQPIYTSLDS